MHLNSDCVKEVLEEFGFKRVNWVLANTVQEKSWDGRFRQDNKAWAQRTFIPEDAGHKVEFIVESHPLYWTDSSLKSGRPTSSCISLDPSTVSPIPGRTWTMKERCWY